jgi:ribosomal-protein-alanine N-acetyltransferase
MFARRNRTDNELQTERLLMRPPQMRDYEQWAKLRRDSQAFLSPWEPEWSRDHLTSRAFRNRVVWAERAIRQGEAYPLFLFRQKDGQVIGENIASRRLLERCGFKYEGVAQAYLQIGGEWRDHVLYAALRADRSRRAKD